MPKQKPAQVVEELKKTNIDPEQIAIIAAAVAKAMDKDGPASRTVKHRSLDKSDYPNITKRLMELPELARKAMKENYKITWNMELREYDGKDGLWYRVPVHVFKLFRFPTEEELQDSQDRGGSLTKDTEIEEQTHMQTDDESTTTAIAAKLGYKVGRDFADYDQLLDEIRFTRVKRWLTDLLIPSRPNEEQISAPKELVIGGTVKKVHQLGGGEVMVESERILK